MAIIAITSSSSMRVNLVLIGALSAILVPFCLNETQVLLIILEIIVLDNQFIGYTFIQNSYKW